MKSSFDSWHWLGVDSLPAIRLFPLRAVASERKDHHASEYAEISSHWLSSQVLGPPEPPQKIEHPKTRRNKSHKKRQNGQFPSPQK
eukprot:4490049-Amphidinium_carterae.2